MIALLFARFVFEDKNRGRGFVMNRIARWRVFPMGEGRSIRPEPSPRVNKLPGDALG
jgi:hypothetical protein